MHLVENVHHHYYYRQQHHYVIIKNTVTQFSLPRLLFPHSHINLTIRKQIQIQKHTSKIALATLSTRTAQTLNTHTLTQAQPYFVHHGFSN